MGKKAVILGATGATGVDLLSEIIKDPYYEKVQVLVRKPFEHPPLSQGKLTTLLTDFKNFDSIQDNLEGDFLFICFGTTLKKAGSKKQQWAIDYEIPLKVAEIARIKGFEKIILVSSYGANADSKIFYSRMKGKLDESILNLNFPASFIFKPGALIRKNSDRFGEKLGVKILQSLNKLGLFKKFRPLRTETLAFKMKEAPKSAEIGATFYVLDEIQ